MTSRKTIALLCLLLVAACAVLAAYSRRNQPLPLAYVALPAPTPGPPDMRPPQLAEAKEAIKRVYGQAVTIEAGSDSSFIAGDLNGDGAPDLAVVVKPAPDKVQELNHELANWIRGDPRRVELPDPKVHVRRLSSAAAEPIIIRQDDLLLAIIHGYGPSGWRHAQAHQSYLLKNAVGSSMKLQTLDEAIKMPQSSRPLQLLGDVVRQTLTNEQGMLFYTGAHYAWHRIEPSGTDVSGTRQKNQKKG